MNDYVSKPFDESQLFGTIERSVAARVLTADADR
jgi:hypothetical protein